MAPKHVAKKLIKILCLQRPPCLLGAALCLPGPEFGSAPLFISIIKVEGRRSHKSAPKCIILHTRSPWAESQRVTTSHKSLKTKWKTQQNQAGAHLCCVFTHSRQVTAGKGTCPGAICVWACVLTHSQRVAASHNSPKTTAWAGALREEEGSLGPLVLCFLHIPSGSQQVITDKTTAWAGAPRAAGGRRFLGATCAVLLHAPSRSQ